jgi:hypothetical protein
VLERSIKPGYLAVAITFLEASDSDKQSPTRKQVVGSSHQNMAFFFFRWIEVSNLEELGRKDFTPDGIKVSNRRKHSILASFEVSL